MIQEIFIKYRSSCAIGRADEKLYFVRPKSEPGWGVKSLRVEISPAALKQMRELLESPDAKD